MTKQGYIHTVQYSALTLHIFHSTRHLRSGTFSSFPLRAPLLRATLIPQLSPGVCPIYLRNSNNTKFCARFKPFTNSREIMKY